MDEMDVCITYSFKKTHLESFEWFQIEIHRNNMLIFQQAIQVSIAKQYPYHLTCLQSLSLEESAKFRTDTRIKPADPLNK